MPEPLEVKAGCTGRAPWRWKPDVRGGVEKPVAVFEDGGLEERAKRFWVSCWSPSVLGELLVRCA